MQFCCDEMKINITELETIHYNEVFDEYGIAIPDDSSFMLLTYCPWCGKKMPDSKRYEWFEKLEKLGFDCPLFDDNIPPEFKTAEWRNG